MLTNLFNNLKINSMTEFNSKNQAELSHIEDISVFDMCTFCMCY